MKFRLVPLALLAGAALVHAQERLDELPPSTPLADSAPAPEDASIGAPPGDQPAPPPSDPTRDAGPAPENGVDPNGGPEPGDADGITSVEDNDDDLGIATQDEGYIIRNADLNDIFQFLAREAGRQYFHNARITGPDYTVTGHLNDGNPLQQMEEIAFMYGLSLHVKGNTIYALTQAQLAQLPSTEFHYQLRYLRPGDMDQILELLRPMLTPGSGIVNFEPKTNTIIVIDTAHRIESVRNLLHNVDKAKGQIVVETKILRVNSNAADRAGVSWERSLGEQGVPISIARDLNSIFGLDSGGGAGGVGGGNPNLVLSPFVASGVLRALADGGLAEQISNPTLITEDNEQATISIIDRIPIITTTTNQGTSTTSVSEEVRYRIDQSDSTIDQDPDTHREIGISLVVTPTLLPDGTIRMRMRPRSAQIVEQIESVTGNFYPRVTESMVEALARVPDGHSLVVGGFYGETTSSQKNKVPLLGDIPMINFFFKSRESIKEETSLVFIVTPKSYDPRSAAANNAASSQVRASTTIDPDATWANPDNPGPAHEPNLRRTIRGMQPREAPYYPAADEVRRGSADEGNTRRRPARGSRRF